MQLTAEQIPIALGRTTHPIDLRDETGARIARLTTGSELLMYLERGYQFHGTKRRVRYIAPGEPLAAPLLGLTINRWVARYVRCWRNQSAATIAFHGCQISPGILSRLAAS